MTDSERIYELVERVNDFAVKVVDKTTELKQENSELKQRIAELEKPKKKRRLRAMTCQEFCDKWQLKHNNKCCEDELCPLFFVEWCEHSNKPFRKQNGKYILIEVKE